MPRPRLFAELDRGTGLVLIGAPAGSGKTSLLASWQVPNRLWVRLDEADQDPCRLVDLLAAAADDASPGSGRRARLALAGGASPLVALALLLAALELDGQPRTLILDDCHVLDGASGAEAVLEALVRTAPPTLRLVLAGRILPRALALSASAMGMLRVLGGAELAIRPEESAELLAAHGLPAHGAADLARAADGWALAIVLTAQALAGNVRSVHLPPEELVPYLLMQIVDALPARLRDFVLETAVLGAFTPADADRILQRTDSAAQLEELRRRGLFLEAVGSAASPAGEVRYHDLLAAALASRLATVDPMRVRAIRLAVADACSADPPRALVHVAALEDAPLLCSWLERLLVPLVQSWLWETIIHYGELVTPPARSVTLLRLLSLARYRRGEELRAMQVAEQAQLLAEACGDQIGRFSALVLRANPLVRQDRCEEALALCLPAIAEARAAGLPLAQGWLQCLCVDAYLRAGRLSEGMALASQVLVRLRARAGQGTAVGDPTARMALIDLLFNMATALELLGEDQECERALAEAELLARDANDAAAIARCATARCGLLSLRGQPDIVLAVGPEAATAALGHGDLPGANNALSDLALAALHLGRYTDALEILNRLEGLLATTDVASWHALALALRARVHLAAGQREEARHTLGRVQVIALIGNPAAQRQVAAGLLALADAAPQDALQLFERAAGWFAAHGYQPDRAFALVLQAAAHVRLGRRDRAIRCLSQVGTLVMPTSTTWAPWRARLAYNVAPVLADLGILAHYWRVQGGARRLLVYVLTFRDLPHTRRVPAHAIAARALGGRASTATGDQPVLRFVPFGIARIGWGEQTESLQPMPTDKAAELLAYAVWCARPIERSELLQALWEGEEDAERAPRALHVASYQLRRLLGAAAWKRERGQYRLDARVQDDWRALLALASEAGDPLLTAEERCVRGERGLALYCGPYLSWCSSLWVQGPRVLAQTAAAKLATLLAESLRALGQPLSALAAAERGLSIDPQHEELRAIQFALLAELGRPHEAKEQYRRYVRYLKREGLGAPAPELTTLARRLFQAPRHDHPRAASTT